VLNNRPGVSEKTRSKVLSVLREHQDLRGVIQRSLIGELSQLVGLIVGDINNPFFIEVISGLTVVLRENGYRQILIHGTEQNTTEVLGDIGMLVDYNPLGYVVLAGGRDEHLHLFDNLAKTQRPMVAVGQVKNAHVHTLQFANREGSAEITSYLIARGHRHIVCLSGYPQSEVAKERVLGFLESLVRNEIPVKDFMTVSAGSTALDGYLAALEVLRDTQERPTAMVCFSDRVAIGAYRAAHELRLRIPDDISIVGFDGVEIGDLLGPPLTTMSVFPYEAGKTMGEMLLKAIRGENGRGPMKTLIRPTLIERGSVRDI